MKYLRIFCCNFLLFLFTCLSAQAAADVSPAAQKRMSIVLSQVTRDFLYSFKREDLSASNNISKAVAFAVSHLDRYHFRSKVFRNSNGLGPLLVLPKDVNEVLLRFFEFTLPPDLAAGTYNFVSFDGKVFSYGADMSEVGMYAYVQHAKEEKNGLISVQGILSHPTYSKGKHAFTAVLKPILWQGLHTYAVISITKAHEIE